MEEQVNPPVEAGDDEDLTDVVAADPPVSDGGQDDDEVIQVPEVGDAQR